MTDNVSDKDRPMEVLGETATRIDGRDYWLVNQFAKLTNRNEGSIRVLINKGNRLRNLKTIRIGGKPFINAEELFDFPFVIVGRPAVMGDYIETFYLENGELLREEKIFDPCQ